MKFLHKHVKDSESKEILSKGFSFIVIRIGGTLLSFAFTLYVTNRFGKVEWGLMALGFSIFTILSIFGRLGLDLNLVKFYSQDENLIDTGVFFRSIIKVFIFSSFLSLLIYVFGEALVTDVFLEPKPDLLPYLNWLLLSIPFWSMVFVSAAIMRARKMNKAFAFYTLVGRFAIILLIILLIAHDSALFVLKAHFISLIILAIASLVHANIILKKPTFYSSHNTWVFVKESLPMMLSSSILVLMSWMDTFVMGIYENETEVGIYNVAVKVTTLSVFSLQAINSILAPKIAKSYAENQTVAYKKLIQFSTKVNFFITFFIVGLIIILSPYLLGLFGDGFEAGISVLIILCIGQLVNSLSGSVGVVMQMIGEQKMYQYFIVSALIINLILTLILTPIYGGVGAATATVASMVFWNISGAVFLKKKKNIRTYFLPSLK
ncbi:flippase [Flavobacteriaceae bacterium 14752]|nr:flippase [Flavobacteriaceae bacterium 14752]